MPARDAVVPAHAVVLSFDGSEEPWTSLDDRVMGGRSCSAMTVGGGLGVFAGKVSLANEGGFASVRSARLGANLSGFDGLEFEACGDGKCYALRIRTSTSSSGVSYHRRFDTTEGRWVPLRLAFTDFQPVFRGRPVVDHPRLDLGAIETLGLMISDRQRGPFCLTLRPLRAYVDSPHDG